MTDASSPAGPVRRDRHPGPVLAAVGAGACGAASLLLAHRAGLEPGIVWRRGTLAVDIALWWAAFALGAVLLLRAPRRTALWLLVVVTVAVRLAAVTPKAPTSDDLYRYAWDGRVQVSGTSPYAYPPSAPEVAGLRDGWLFPSDADCAKLRLPDRCLLINRPDVITIYPPVAEAWFTAVHLVVPTSWRDRGLEGVGLVLDLAVFGLLLALLRRRGQDLRWAVLYGWCPLPVLEVVSNAHVDGLAVLLVLGAVAHVRRRPLLAAALLTGAALVKVWPAVLLALVARGRWWAVTGIAAGIGTVAYLPHVLAVGPKVIGYLPGYLTEENYGTGSRFLVIGLFGITGVLATVVAALTLLLTVVLVVRARVDLPLGALVVFGVLLLVTTPVQPWYAVALVALVVLTTRWEWLAVAAAGYPQFFATILNTDPLGPSDTWGRAAYGSAALVVVTAALLRRRNSFPTILPDTRTTYLRSSS